MKETGCERILFGVESGNDYVRNDVMKRSMSRDTIVNAFKMVHTYGIKTTAINIIGVPGETEEMLLDTIKLNREIKPGASGVNIFYPYKGTKLGDYCFDSNLVDDNSILSFNNERRETILNYDDKWKEKLSYYYLNWGIYIYPIWSIKGIQVRILKFPRLGKVVMKIYHVFFGTK